MRSSTGRSALLTLGQIAEAMPSGMPTIVDKTIATVINASVVMALGHICEIPFGPPLGICRTPNELMTRAEKSAVRHVPTIQAKTVAAARTPTHVIQWSRLTTSFVALFRRFPKPLTMWWRKKLVLSLFVTQLLRLSNQRGTPRYQPAGKPEWKPSRATATMQRGSARRSGGAHRLRRPPKMRAAPGRRSVVAVGVDTYAGSSSGTEGSSRPARTWM